MRATVFLYGAKPEVRMASLSTVGAHVVGVKQVLRALKAGDLTTVYLAMDAAPALLAEVIELAQQRDVPIEWVKSMALLARRFHVEVKSAAAGVKKGDTSLDGQAL